MYEQLISTHNLVDSKRLFCCNVGISNLFTIIFERCNHKPSVAIHKHLVGAHAVPNGVVVEFCVINKVSATVVGSYDAVVSLRTFAHSHESPFIVCSHQLFATSVAIIAIVHHVRIKNGTLTLSIFIWTVRLFRAEHSHLVSTIRRIETIAHKEIIIFAYVLYV